MRLRHRDAAATELPRIAEIYKLAVAIRESSCDLEPTTVAARQPEALLFDLGGVVIDIDFKRAFRGWQAISRYSFAEIERNFQFDDCYAQHERGQISTARYLAHLAAPLGLIGSIEQITAAWNDIFVGEIAETTALIRLARAQLPCFAFTNTNAAHQQAWSRRFPHVVSLFDRIFASHEMGCRKPESRAFEFIARPTGHAAGAIMFFDDLAENVEGARLAGLQAVHVSSPMDVRLALRRIGVAA